MLSRMFSAVALAGAALVGALAGSAAAQDNWPTRPITLISPFAAGGGADFVARLIAAGIEDDLGQSVIVEARPGGGGVIGANFVAQAEPDGYTIMLTPAAPLVNAPLLRPDTVPYDPQTDLEPLMKLVVSPIMVITNSKLEATNLKELVDLAKASPGKISIGNSGAGSTQQLLSLMFQGGTGTELNMIAYTGSGEIVPDLVAGRLNMMLDFPAAYAAYVESGDVRLLASLSDKRLPLFPDVPTVSEAGFPEVPAWSGWFGLFAPDGVPVEVKEKLTTAIRNYLNSDEAKEKLAAGGYTPDPASVEDLKALMDHERNVLTGLVDKYNLKQ